MKRFIPLVLIVLMFVVPMYLAWQLTSNKNHKNTVNYGKLIIPIIPASKAGIGNATWLKNHKWTILYYAPNCFGECIRELNLLHRIHKATAKEQHRVQRVLLTSSYTQDIPKGTIITEINPYRDQPLAFKSGSIYLVDPQGNVMMRYSQDHREPRGILKDMERLLSASKIGMKAGG